MSTGRAAALLSSLALGLPHAGTLIPGRSLAGVRLGDTYAQVRSTWGPRFGRCRGCTYETWYFGYRPFEPQGAAVSFGGGRVIAAYTLAAPRGWHTNRGLRIGDPAARVTALYGRRHHTRCDGYSTIRIAGAKAAGEIYVAAGRVYGFGLTRPALPACR